MPPQEALRTLQRLTGRVIGVNLEAVDPAFATEHNDFWQMTAGRAATAENARKLYQLGARMLVLTGNPNNGVSNQAIAVALKAIRDEVGDEMVLVTGKMHGAGIVRESGSQLIGEQDIALFVENGADIVLLPAPGTIPGMSQEKVAALINFAQRQGALAMTAIGTSQEGRRADRAADCADEQNGRGGSAPYRRYRLSGAGAAGKHLRLQRGDSRRAPHLQPHGALGEPLSLGFLRRHDAEIAERRQHLSRPEADVVQQVADFPAGVLAALRPSHHHQAVPRGGRRPVAVIVVQHFVDHDPAPGREGRIALLRQKRFLSIGQSWKILEYRCRSAAG